MGGSSAQKEVNMSRSVELGAVRTRRDLSRSVEHELGERAALQLCSACITRHEDGSVFIECCSGS